MSGYVEAPAGTRGRALVQVVTWSILAGCLWWAGQRVLASPVWFVMPLLVLLITCLLGVGTGLLQAAAVVGVLLVTAWLESAGRLFPVGDPGPWLRAGIAGGVVVGMALCGALLHRTLHLALQAEEAQDERLDTTLKALRHRERLLRHALRVETVGEVSGMVVHQLRNQFQVIMGHAAAGIRNGDPQSRESFRAIMDTLGGSRTLMESLLGLASDQVSPARRVDLGDLCQAVGERYGPLLPKTCVLELRRSPDRLPVVLDPHGLEHALLNLLINARQAMESEGTITMEVAPTAHGTAMLRVRDTGPGIAPEHLEEIFKPFFTTKPRGQGTGLGLAAVQRFVVASNGEISVESGSEPGACFRLCFPLVVVSGDVPGQHLAPPRQATG
jgi:signal transduction histidine kinase